jgi:hypothetical protein
LDRYCDREDIRTISKILGEAPPTFVIAQLAFVVRFLEALNSYVNQVGLSFKDAQAIDRKCAEALWGKCT